MQFGEIGLPGNALPGVKHVLSVHVRSRYIFSEMFGIYSGLAGTHSVHIRALPVHIRVLEVGLPGTALPGMKHVPHHDPRLRAPVVGARWFGLGSWLELKLGLGSGLELKLG